MSHEETGRKIEKELQNKDRTEGKVNTAIHGNTEPQATCIANRTIFHLLVMVTEDQEDVLRTVRPCINQVSHFVSDMHLEEYTAV